MIEPIILFDETLDFNHSNLYDLSILIQKNGLSFLILDQQTNKLIGYKYLVFQASENFKEFLFFLDKALKTEDILSYKYHRVIVLLQSFKSITVPNSFYDSNLKDAFVKLGMPISDEEVILSNELLTINATKLFLVHEAVLNLVHNYFENPLILHQTTPLINSDCFEKESKTVILNLSDAQFDIQIFEDEKLLLDNSFKYKTKEDLLYYLLYTFEQLDIKPKEQKITLYSNYKSDDEIIRFLNQYIGQIQLAQFTRKINYSYLFSKVESQNIAAQILSFLCV